MTEGADKRQEALGVLESERPLDRYERAAAIRAAYAAGEGGYSKLAKRFGVTPAKVQSYVRNAGLNPGPTVPTQPNLSDRIEKHVANHARDRLMERYGISATPDEWREAVAQIVRVRGVCGSFVRIAQDQEKEVWDVILRERPVRMVFDRKEMCVVTVLPLRSGSAGGGQ